MHVLGRQGKQYREVSGNKILEDFWAAFAMPWQCDAEMSGLEVRRRGQAVQAKYQALPSSLALSTTGYLYKHSVHKHLLKKTAPNFLNDVDWSKVSFDDLAQYTPDTQGHRRTLPTTWGVRHLALWLNKLSPLVFGWSCLFGAAFKDAPLWRIADEITAEQFERARQQMVGQQLSSAK